MVRRLACLWLSVTLLATGARAVTVPSAPQAVGTWDRVAAAHYLDSRQTWWMSWPMAQRDHQTACISCHTAVPYAMARPALRLSLGETSPSVPERQMLGYIIKRVNLWDQVKPFYSDADVAPMKTIESRGTESVLNALVLCRYDAQTGKLSPAARRALANMWSMQITGKTSRQEDGSWNWLNFHNAPWESDESHYYGATLAAIAVGLAPANYSANAAIQPQLHRLAAYLSVNYDAQPLVNRIVLLWASSKLPGLLSISRRTALLADIETRQQADGGWSLADLGAWKRYDNTPIDERSDGYATGLTVYVLTQAGISSDMPELKKAVQWLLAHQDREQGLWRAYSLNKQRDPATDIGRFMSDAATSYSVMALQSVQK